MIGTMISHYKILDKIGEGGMGVVYRARDTKLDRTVALKFLPSHLGADESEKQRFLHEAKSASALDHTNICSIHSIEETDDRNLFIVMAYYEGVSLKEKIEQGPLPLKDVINYAHQIASGLQKAHEKGVVHRDLKPANIFITNDDQVKIIDFGLAKAAQQTMLTKSGTTLGTVPYMSPEQAQGSKVDHRTDIWSLGIVMYEMVTGQLPFKSEYDTALVYSIVNEDPEPVTALRSGVPMELERIINKCLEKEPADRYQQTNEIIIDLRKVEKDISSGIRKNISRPAWQKERTVAAGDQPALLQKKHFLYGIPVLLILLIVFFLLLPDRTVISEVESSIAVLPFESLSPNPADDYFAAGIHEDIIIQLAKIEDITVIGRGSVGGYKPGRRDYRTIGNELGVSTLLEGSVRRDADRVRVSVNLIDAETSQTLWAERYDRDMTDLFFIQANIAEEISLSLEASLSPRERESIAYIPTHSTRAYDYYLQAREYQRRDYYNPEDITIAIELYERAIELDPDFALAYAGLSNAHMMMHWFAYDLSEERLQKAHNAIERALTLEPDHPEVRLDYGMYQYQRFRNYDLALEEFAYARNLMPNHDMVYFNTGAVKRRTAQWDEAQKNIERAYELDPLNFIKIYELIGTYWATREFSKADSLNEKALALFPDSDTVIEMIMWSDINAIGNVRYSIDQLLREWPDFYTDHSRRWHILYKTREFEYIIENEHDFPGDVIDVQWLYYPKSLLFALAYDAQNDSVIALQYYGDAQESLEELRSTYPEDYRYRAALGKTYAGLGLKDKAIAEGKKAMELMSSDKDAVFGVRMEVEMAKIYSLLGETDLALEYIERLLEVPTDQMNIGRLRTSPYWDPLRGDPRFRKIISEG